MEFSMSFDLIFDFRYSVLLIHSHSQSVLLVFHSNIIIIIIIIKIIIIIITSWCYS